MGFPPAARSGDIVLRADNLAKAYDRPLFANLDLQITRGQRWGILGPNGSGKTTLLRCLLGQLKPDSGHAHLGQGVMVGYFDQHLSTLDDATPVMDAIRPNHKDFVEQRRRDLLARFGLVGDTALKPVGTLSGGERCRAALARLAAADANFLVLDEPTNHLDLWARDALERALGQFDGTVLFVSHDRYFVNQVADHLLVVESDRFRVIEGNYETYQHLLQSGLAGQTSQPVKEQKAESSGRAERAKSGVKGSKRRFPYRKVEDLETEISEREAQIEELQLSLADPNVLRDGDRVRAIKSEITQQQETLQTLYAHWEEAVELNW